MPNKTWEDAPGTLPKQARTIWAAAFNSAWDGTCEDSGERRDECASRVAWGAVKRDYKKKGDKWVKKSLSEEVDLGSFVEKAEPTGHMDFIIAKASSSGGKMRWVARASDTLKDNLDTQMTTQLFSNFLDHQDIVGLPYLSIAHYGALQGKGIAGTTESMWIDGIAFKAKGEFADNSLGRALFGAILKERNDPSIKSNDLIRLSIGFVDLVHKHGNYLFQRRSLDDPCPLCLIGQLPTHYLDGVLVHLAATRVPINERTNINAEDAIAMRGSTILTRRGDAASIIGEELADQLQRLTDEGFDDEVGQERALVVKSDGEEEEVQPASKVELALQETRSRRYGIAIRSDGNAIIPQNLKKLGISFADFGDPVNCLFPTWMTISKDALTSVQLKQMSSAASDFMGDKLEYDSKSRGRISERIQRALQKFTPKTERGIYPGDVYDPYYGAQTLPLGGATTYQGAQEWLESQEARSEFYDQVGVMDTVMSNILRADSTDIGDRKKALRNAMEEFMDDLGNLELDSDDQGDESDMSNQTAVVEESAAIPAPVPVVTPPPAVATVPAVIPVVAPAVTPAPAEVKPTAENLATLSAAMKPVANAMEDFQKGVFETLEDEAITPEERLQKIQPMLETMSAAIVQASSPSPGESEVALVTALRSALSAELAPLSQSLQLLITKLAGDTHQGPVRRTFSHVAGAANVPSDPQSTTSIASIARRSVGLDGEPSGS